MSEYLSLKEAEQLGEEMAPFPRPGVVTVVLGMVREPDETLKQAFAHPVMDYAHTLAAVGGIYWTLNFLVAQASGGATTLGGTLAFGLLGGAALGIGYLYALTVLLTWSVDILGGEPHRRQIRMALAYAGVPGCLALVLFTLPRIALFGPALLQPGWGWVAENPLAAGVLVAGDAAFLLWSVMLLLRALRLMNDFHLGRALAALVVPLLPLVLIGMLFWVLMAVGGFFQAEH